MPESDDEMPSPVTAFLAPLGLGRRGVMKQLGYDDIADLSAQTPEEAQDMKTELKEAGVAPGHVGKIMRAASAGQASTSSASIAPHAAAPLGLPLPSQNTAIGTPPSRSVGSSHMESQESPPTVRVCSALGNASTALVQTSMCEAASRRKEIQQQKVTGP